MALTIRDLQAAPAIAARQQLADRMLESLAPAIAARQQMWSATQLGEAITIRTADLADELVRAEISATGAPGVRLPIALLVMRVLLAVIVECLIIVVWQAKKDAPEDALMGTFFAIATWWQLDDALWKWLSR